ncbi:DUF2764 family protein [bacterium]|nr:DUF2764 family protein [bacterium]
MDKYVYLIAQLPTLFFDKAPAMTVSAFLEEAGKWMGNRDLRKLEAVQLLKLDPDIRLPREIREIQQFEEDLRQDLAEWRQSRKRGAEYKPGLFPLSAVREGNPLEVEKKLLLLRWRFIDQFEQDHHFDLTLLMLYYLKLQILEKLAIFNREKGLERFQQISKVSA